MAYLPKHKAVQDQRKRVARAWWAMQETRMEYLRQALELNTMQGDEAGCKRFTWQIAQLEEAMRQRHPQKRDRFPANSTENGAIESPQNRDCFNTDNAGPCPPAVGAVSAERPQCERTPGRNASASPLTINAADAASE